MAVDCVISWKPLSVTFLALDIFVWWCHCLLIWFALVIFESWQTFLLPAVCLDVFFLLDISLSISSSDDGTFSPSSLRLSCLNFDSLFLVDSSQAWDLTHSPLLTSYFFPFSLHPRMLFAAVSLRCYILSSVPYSLHFPTLFSSSSNLCCLHISTVLTSLLSSHLYSLHIPTLFTSTFSSHLFFFTSLLSSTLERRTQTRPVAQTRFPTSTPGATFRDKHRVSCDSYPPSITWTNRWSSHSAAKCKPGSPNTMAQRIFKNTSAQRWQWGTLERQTSASRTRRTTRFPHGRREPLYARKHMVSFTIVRTSPWCEIHCICNHWPANQSGRKPKASQQGGRG